MEEFYKQMDITPIPAHITQKLLQYLCCQHPALSTIIFNIKNQDQAELIDQIIAQKIIQPEALARSLATYFDLPYIDLSHINSPMPHFNNRDFQLLYQYNLLALQLDTSTLVLATYNPAQTNTQKIISFQLNQTIDWVVVAEDLLRIALEKAFQQQQQYYLQQISQHLPQANTASMQVTAINTINDDEPVLSLIDNLFAEAIKNKASDIHFEQHELYYRVRYRIDGILKTVAMPPINLASRIISRLKIMAALNITEQRLPQDGRFQLISNTQETIDFRLSTCPTVHGEKIVLRLLQATKHQRSLDELGLTTQQHALVQNAIRQPQGLILITGPTGSGKTSTLYTILSTLNTDHINISSVENPVEMKLSGINQVNIQPEIGLSFANTLRALLRQDPDIIMIGEIRDAETANIAIQAAQTGHLVLATLHTNNAVETLTRLKSLGISPFYLAHSIILIIAQRLARKLCASCKKFDHIKNIYHAHFCSNCHNGYAGRIGLFEVLPIVPSMRQAIMQKANTLTLYALAKQHGLLTLYEAGIQQMHAGVLDIHELQRCAVEQY